MIYPYKEITQSIQRPIIPLIIKSSKMLIFYEGLVDSGADHCIFSLEIARKLGIKPSDKKRIEFTGVGKDVMIGFWGQIDLKLAGIFYEAKVIFADISDFGHGILGQKGFFDHFDVKLSYQKQLVEIKPVPN